MKYLKKYEFEEQYQDLNVGDKVICLTGSKDFLIYDNIYEIEEIKKHNHYRQFKLIGVKYFWESDRFRKATEEEIIHRSSKKYNI